MNNLNEFISITTDIIKKPSNAAIKIKNNNYLHWALLLILLWELLNLITNQGILINLNQPTNYSVLLYNLFVIFVLFPISINFVANILGGKGNYKHALQTYIFCNIPLMFYSFLLAIFLIINQYWGYFSISLLLEIFSWIQFVITIWVTLLFIISVKIIYQLSYGRALITVIIFYPLALLAYLLLTYLRLQ